MSRQKPPADAPAPMHLTIPRDRLEPALALALEAADKKAHVYDHVLLTALPLRDNATGSTGQLEIAATDGDAMIRILVPAEVAAGGSVAVPAETLRKAAKLLPEQGFVTLSVADIAGHGRRLVVACDRARYRLQTLPVDDFPVIGITDITHSFELAGTALARAMALCKIAVSDEETRYYLNGVFMAEDAGGDLVFVATDGHSLVRVALPMPQDSDGTLAGGLAGVILPRTGLKQIETLAHGVAGEPVSIDLSKDLARFRAGTIVYTTKLVDGAFPDYTRVIPAERAAAHAIAVDAAALVVALARARVVTEDKARAVSLEVSDDAVSISARGTNGEASDAVEAALDGEPITIGFNGVMLAELLKLVPAGDAVLHLADDQSPARITADALTGVTMVLMPMRVGPAAPAGEGGAS